jgi:hypothetical protein
MTIPALYQFYTSFNIKYIPTSYQAKISLEIKIITKLVWKSLKVWNTSKGSLMDMVMGLV